MMKKIGELENVSIPSRDWKANDSENELYEAVGTEPSNSVAAVTTSSENKSTKFTKAATTGKPESGLDAIRDALSL